MVRAGANLAKAIKQLKRTDLIVSHRYSDWLVKNPDLVMDADDVALFARLLGSKRGSRVGVWTGSQAGKCERYQVFNYMGLPQLVSYDPRQQNLFHDGTWRHVRWQISLTKAIPGFQAELPTSVSAAHFLGAIDGAHFDEGWGFELKGTSNFTKAVSQGVFDEHRLQATRYWLSTDQDPNYPQLKKWVFVYEDKSTQEWREIVVDRDAYLEKQVEQEYRRLNNAVRDKELPPIIPACAEGTGQQYRWCSYKDKCLTIKSWQQAQALITGEDAKASTRRSTVAIRNTSKPTSPVVGRQRRKLAGH